MQLNAYGTNAILITYVHLKQSIMFSMQIPQISSNCNKLRVFLIWQAEMCCCWLAVKFDVVFTHHQSV